MSTASREILPGKFIEAYNIAGALVKWSQNIQHEGFVNENSKIQQDTHDDQFKFLTPFTREFNNQTISSTDHLYVVILTILIIFKELYGETTYITYLHN